MAEMGFYDLLVLTSAILIYCFCPKSPISHYFPLKFEKNINWPNSLSQNIPSWDTQSISAVVLFLPVICPWTFNLWQMTSNISWSGCIILLIPPFLHGSRNSQTPRKNEVEREEEELWLLAEILSPPQPLAGDWTKAERAATSKTISSQCTLMLRPWSRFAEYLPLKGFKMLLEMETIFLHLHFFFNQKNRFFFFPAWCTSHKPGKNPPTFRKKTCQKAQWVVRTIKISFKALFHASSLGVLK